jgi:hypothetical protein
VSEASAVWLLSAMSCVCCCAVQQTGGGAPSRREAIAGLLGAALGVGATTAYFKGAQRLQQPALWPCVTAASSQSTSSWLAVLAGNAARCVSVARALLLAVPMISTSLDQAAALMPHLCSCSQLCGLPDAEEATRCSCCCKLTSVIVPSAAVAGSCQGMGCCLSPPA